MPSLRYVPVKWLSRCWKARSAGRSRLRRRSLTTSPRSRRRGLRRGTLAALRGRGVRSDRSAKLSSQALQLLNRAIALSVELGNDRLDLGPAPLAFLDDLSRGRFRRRGRLPRVLVGLRPHVGRMLVGRLPHLPRSRLGLRAELVALLLGGPAQLCRLLVSR